MKKILFINYMFPPVGGGGVIRVTKFIKFLPEFGWKPYVLTVKKALYYIKDNSLSKEIPNNIYIQRINYFEPALWFKNKYWQSFFVDLLYPLIYIPDRQILWLVPALLHALKIIKKENIKIIFTSSSSYTDHLVALIVKKITKVKWIADFRDEWSTNPGLHFPTPFHYKLNQYLEKKVVQNADQIIGVSDPITSFLSTLSDDKSKFTTLTNGYDLDDYKKYIYKKNKICHFLYAGALYGNAKNNELNNAIKELKLKNISFDFIGNKNRLNHAEAVKKIAQADVLLLILSSDFRPAVYTGKLFEYLAARRPILALAPKETAAAKLIKKIKVGSVVHPQDKDAIKNEILKYYKLWQKDQLYLPFVNIEKYNRKNITRKLANIFNSKIEIKRKIKLCFIGDSASIHNIRFVNYFKDKFDIYFISSSKNKIRGIKVYYLNSMSGLYKLKPIYFLANILKIRKLIRRIKPDIIHGQNIIHGTWANLSGFKPVITTAWGSDIFLLGKRSYIEQKLVIKTLKNVNAITFDSDALGKEIKKVSQRSKGLHEIQFGVDTQKFCPVKVNPKYRKSIGIKLTDKIIFCPRGMTKIYNIDILIKAFAKLEKNDTNLKLVLLKFGADPSYLGYIIKLIKKLHISNKVILLESVSSNEMIKLYQLADVVVSIPTSDSSPVSVFEAMACGKKIVLTDLFYVKEWLSPQKDNFYLVKTNDISATAKCISKALINKNFNRIKNYNLNLINEKVSTQQNMDLMEKLYREII